MNVAEKITINIKEFIHSICPECGNEFLIKKLYAEVRKGLAIYCPNGHRSILKED